jgi:Fe-S cluster assembly ATP-binding protein
MKQDIGLSINNLTVSVENKEILHGLSLVVKPGEIHAVMGPNGSGKSTLAYALMGHPNYLKAVDGRRKAEKAIVLNGNDISDLPTDGRAKAGLFLAMQSPIAIPGVSVINLLREGYQEINSAKTSPIPKLNSENPVLARRFNVADLTIAEFMGQIKKLAKKLAINESLLTRGIHDGFSGGERKKIEMLEALILKPKYAIFDEIDTGLDVDALKTVAAGITLLQSQKTGIIVVTHYQRILKYLKPDFVHILVNGKIVDSGKSELAKEIENAGYKKYLV